MDIGLVAFITDYGISSTELAQAAESRGFESLFLTEHTHIPAARETPYADGRELPTEYSHTFDPFVSLAAAAAVTDRIKLGTGICLVSERDPIVLAKEVASLDQLSGGRVLFGVGAGWNKEEMRNHGVDPARRWTVTGERIKAMQAIWSQEEATYHGEYVDFDRIWSWPKPAQTPWAPVLVSGGGRGALDRVLEYGDGWLPIYGEVRDRLPEMITTLREGAAERGRPAPSVTVYWAPREVEVLSELAAAGVDRVLLRVPVGTADVVLPRLDSYAPLFDAVG
ncbi:MAG: LLM class F420-dependent oxidoreductase [Actinomycetota bacterium]|nr:MAG: LLM class F420-dependent oxidoreductase [Actinomycetota bacterium]